MNEDVYELPKGDKSINFLNHAFFIILTYKKRIYEFYIPNKGTLCCDNLPSVKPYTSIVFETNESKEKIIYIY